MLPIDGIALAISPEHLWLSSDQPLRVISSAVVGGELRHARHVLSMRVPLDYRNRTPEDDLFAKSAVLDIREPFVGLLTAVDLSEAVVLADEVDDLRLLAVVTVGVGNATAAGSISACGTAVGTINIILVVDADLTPSALVNAVITATEAKVLALLGADVRTAAGERASGTSSDAIVVACTGRGRPVRYAGPATSLGLILGRTIHRALTERLTGETNGTH